MKQLLLLGLFLLSFLCSQMSRAAEQPKRNIITCYSGSTVLINGELLAIHANGNQGYHMISYIDGKRPATVNTNAICIIKEPKK